MSGTTKFWLDGGYDRELLRLGALTAGADAFLCYWPPHGERQDIPAEEWPVA